MRIGITCYPTYGGSGVVATELGIAARTIAWQVEDAPLFTPSARPGPMR